MVVGLFHVDNGNINVNNVNIMNILIINGHPDKKSLSCGLSERYAKGARLAGHEVQTLHLCDMEFDPILHKGYKEIQVLEPDLEEAQKKILWANHLVIIYPIWWSSTPALLKGFFDRALLPGFAFKYHPGKIFWDKLLKNRTGEIIVTTDGPNWWNKWFLKDPAINMVKKGVLEFTGIKVKRVTSLAEIKGLQSGGIEKILNKVEALGKVI